MAEARSPGKDTGPDDLGDVWVEVGLREGDVRVRSVFQYGRAAEGASLRRVFLVREGLDRLPTGDGTKEVIERERRLNCRTSGGGDGCNCLAWCSDRFGVIVFFLQGSSMRLITSIDGLESFRIDACYCVSYSVYAESRMKPYQSTLPARLVGSAL